MMQLLKRTSKSLLLLLFLASAAFAQFTQMQIPQPSGNVNDFAGKLNPATKQSLENLLTNFRNKTDIEVAAVLIPYEQMNGYAIEDYALEMGRRWGIGIGANNPAALLLIAIKEKGSDGLYSGNTRLEISRHLEGDIPDGLAGEIIRRMKNDLKAGNFDNAMTTGVQTILATIAEKRGISMDGINSNAAYHPPVRRPQKGISPSTIIIGIIVIFFIINLLGRIGRGGGGGGSRRGSDWWVGPIIWGGGGSGWGGSGSSSGDSGGGWGGFGGGGDFGGGGASDSW